MSPTIHWPVSPAARDRHCREDDRCDASGRERHHGERGGQNHRRDRGHRDERRQDRVMQIGEDPRRRPASPTP
jgi:hypothetical protein